MSFDIFDAIIYINLSHRKDRDIAIQQELAHLNIPKQKIHRIEGAFDIFNGHRGCATSHISALTLALQNSWQRVLILEDDAHFPYSKTSTEAHLEAAFTALPSFWNVLLLGGNILVARETPFAPLKQVLYAQSCHAYAPHPTYIPILKTCFEKSLELMQGDSDYFESQQKKHSIDHQWKSLQTKDHWFVGKILAQQRCSFSDITHTVYGSTFADVGNSASNILLKDYIL